MPRTIGAARFKEQCLALLDSLDPEGIIITKHGRPVAKVVPIEVGSADLIGALESRLVISGDILSTEEAWDAES